MFQKLKVLPFFLLIACATPQKASDKENPSAMPTAATDTVEAKEYSQGEVILTTQMLVKIFDKEMSYLACVPDAEEASLLLRTIRPRMEVVEDDLGAMLDSKEDVIKLVKECHQNCTCAYLDDLLREHLVVLDKSEAEMMKKKKTKKEINRCLTYAQETFCQSDLYKSLEIEKVDFTFDEEGSL
jgi:hypothetical protein